LAGTWQDKSGDQTVQSKINWAGDKNFLVRTINVKGDQSATDGWEIIGWDPVRQQIRSWIFDSNGGFGESTWVQRRGRLADSGFQRIAGWQSLNS
jgi:hypothetical protein